MTPLWPTAHPPRSFAKTTDVRVTLTGVGTWVHVLPKSSEMMMTPAAPAATSRRPTVTTDRSTPRSGCAMVTARRSRGSSDVPSEGRAALSNRQTSSVKLAPRCALTLRKLSDTAGGQSIWSKVVVVLGVDGAHLCTGRRFEQGGDAPRSGLHIVVHVSHGDEARYVRCQQGQTVVVFPQLAVCIPTVPEQNRPGVFVDVKSSMGDDVTLAVLQRAIHHPHTMQLPA